MTRAIPVISINSPRTTNIGTASSSRFEMPSSIRLTTMTSGRSVVSAKYENVAMPKVKAIGTPINTQTATRTTKNRTRLPCPMAISSGCDSHRTNAIAPTRARGNKKPCQVVVSISRSNAITAVRAAPTRIATTRQPSEIDSVISSVDSWTWRYWAAGSNSSMTKTIRTSAPTVPR